MASLRVLSSPPFAELFLDGRSLGVTPLDLAAVAAGPHRLSLKAPGGASLDTVLDLAPGRRTLRFRLETRAVALDAEE